MWTFLRISALAALFAVPALAMTACEDDTPDDLEEMGEQIDEGLDDAGRAIEDALD